MVTDNTGYLDDVQHFTENFGAGHVADSIDNGETAEHLSQILLHHLR